MNNKNEICIGMAGAGRATELHINALRRYTGIPVCLKHIIARNEENLKIAKERYGFINASNNFEDLINDDEIDVIDICTPPYMHEKMIIKSLRAGKHVICEKPLCGYFGLDNDKAPIGKNVSKIYMYDRVIESINRINEEK